MVGKARKNKGLQTFRDFRFSESGLQKAQNTVKMPEIFYEQDSCVTKRIDVGTIEGESR